MKIALGLVLCAVFVSGTVRAQNPPAEYQGWMKSNAATMADLNKSLAGKAAAPVATDIRTLRENLAKIAIYWQVRNVNDGPKFALDADNALAKVAQLAAAGKFDEASATVKTVQANCAGCHMAHQVKAADGSFTIK
jgi:cytochrome c556